VKKTATINPSLEPRSIKIITQKSGNLYESIAIIGKRANQIASTIKEELHSKLEEFASTTDNLEEIHENREQIEISKHYEKLPNPALMATQEFLEDEIYHRNPTKEAAAAAITNI
jgi:DNA-directed RNA polymerase subunit K/omega